MPSSRRVMVVGDYMDDILVRPNGPIRPDTDTAATIDQRGGGSASNLACWLAAATQSEADQTAPDQAPPNQKTERKPEPNHIEVELHARVATADLARIAAQLKSYGVSPCLQPDESEPTGALVVLIDGESRTMLTQRGANDRLSVAALLDAIADTRSSLAWFHLSGYSLFSAIDEAAAQQLIAAAKQRGALVSVDPGSAGFISDFSADKFLAAIAGADVIFPNRDEAALLFAEAGSRANFPLILEKNGIAGGQAFVRGVLTLLWKAAEATKMVDPTGAGDAFAAGFISKALEIDFAAEFANFAHSSNGPSNSSFAEALLTEALASCLEASATLAAKAVETLGARPVVKKL